MRQRPIVPGVGRTVWLPQNECGVNVRRNPPAAWRDCSMLVKLCNLAGKRIDFGRGDGMDCEAV